MPPSNQNQERENVTTANEICNHFFALGARISKKDHDYVLKELNKNDLNMLEALKFNQGE